MKRLVLVLACILPVLAYSQNSSYKSKTYTFGKEKSWSPNQINDIWKVQLHNLETPFEGNSTYRHHLQDLKQKVNSQYPRKAASPQSLIKGSTSKGVIKVDTPSVGKSFFGNNYNYSAPNDNTMAINNDGILISAINTNILFYDTNNDTILKKIILSNFSDTLSGISTHQYDPKVIYDYKEDRFILIYLAGSSSDPQKRTDIIVAFSQDADPLKDWSFYTLPGNPLSEAPHNDTSWTDYPAISLSNDEVFITGNLLRYGGSWQTSFKQSVIWQIDKYDGYNGDSLDTKLYYDIKEGGKNLRNIHPVRGGNEFYGPEMYFLSNRNFSIQSDTFYLLKTSGLMNTNPTLSVDLLRSDMNYGAPPDAQMPGSRFLATNDARVLGAFYQNNHIQFVANTIDTMYGGAAVYHGFINDITGDSVEGYIISGIEFKDSLFSQDTLEFGYPNISYCGIESYSKQAIISFNYTELNVFPGFCVLFSDREKSYSNLVNLKAGDSYISVLSGSLQRWGDYSGTQPMYNDPGKVWVSGLYGRKLSFSRVYGTWISEISNNVKDSPTYIETPKKEIKSKVYPNPVMDEGVHFKFELSNSEMIKIELYDIQGKKIALLYDAPAKQGENLLHFSTATLEAGTYFVRVSSVSGLLHTKKFIVVSGD